MLLNWKWHPTFRYLFPSRGLIKTIWLMDWFMNTISATLYKLCPCILVILNHLSRAEIPLESCLAYLVMKGKSWLFSGANSNGTRLKSKTLVSLVWSPKQCLIFQLLLCIQSLITCWSPFIRLLIRNVAANWDVSYGNCQQISFQANSLQKQHRSTWVTNCYP